MSEEILINVTLMETRVALIENGLLQEIFIERNNARGHVGDIFRGKVVRVMPGMEAAFVDIGLERAAFIHASDITPVDASGFEVRDDEPRTIQELLREGQSLVVQVAKDAISSKGARLTTHLTLPSRNLVYLPRSKHLGISQRSVSVCWANFRQFWSGNAGNSKVDLLSAQRLKLSAQRSLRKTFAF
jgi:ribonuclease G